MAFLDDLKQILEQNFVIAQHLPHEFGVRDQITPKMILIRANQLGSRIDIYRSERIDEQRNWYTEKAGYNKRMISFWFFMMCLFQALAIVCVLLRIAKPSWTYLPTEVFAVAAAGVLSWMQAKRFQELASSYSLTTHEIGFIKGQMENVQDELQFSDFVSDAENAFSREHTQWQARRDR